MVLDLNVKTVEWQLGRKIGELRDTVERDGERQVIGVTCQEITAMLWDHKIRFLQLQGPGGGSDYHYPSWYDRVAGSMPVIKFEQRIERHCRRGGRAILAVKSLRNKDDGHWIVADGIDLLDPTRGPGQRYSVWPAGEPLPMAEAILIHA